MGAGPYGDLTTIPTYPSLASGLHQEPEKPGAVE